MSLQHKRGSRRAGTFKRLDGLGTTFDGTFGAQRTGQGGTGVWLAQMLSTGAAMRLAAC